MAKGYGLTAAYLQTGGSVTERRKIRARSQMTNAVISIPSNIAEGSSRNSKKDYVRFLEYSLGSAYELETQVTAVEMLKYGEKELIELILTGIDEEQKMLQSFITTVGSS
jgi:four helix bundle protein